MPVRRGTKCSLLVLNLGLETPPPRSTSFGVRCISPAVVWKATVPATLTQEYLFMPQQMKTCFVVQVRGVRVAGDGHLC